VSIHLSDRLVKVLATATRAVAFTGAGISAESGVPTFRGTDGIWNKLKPEELASMNGFMKNPALVWEWYVHRKTIMAAIAPNAGHRALVRMERHFEEFAVVTQNIDNLHTRAGSRRVMELHGNIERNYCMQCGKQYPDAAVVTERGIPTCPACGGRIRPDVVWFGEMLPDDEWEAAVRATVGAELFFSIGTSGVVYPAASLPLMAHEAGAYVVEINPEPTPLTSHADEFLRGPAGTLLPAVCEELERHRQPREG
jgi:NAD-dependent deacetylase